MVDRSNAYYIVWQTKALWVAIAISVVSVVFGAGTIYGHFLETDAKVATLSGEVAGLRVNINTLNDDTNKRMNAIENSVALMHGFLLRQFGSIPQSKQHGGFGYGLGYSEPHG